MPKKLLRSRTNVLDDLAKQSRGNVTITMDRDCRSTPVRVVKLLVGASLPDLLEAHDAQDGDDLSRAKDR